MEIIAKQPNLDLERMAEIALLSKAAGEALPEIEAAARGMTVPYKYGMHLANWFNGDSPGLRREVEATLPVSITFLDNVKGEGLNPQVEILHNRGVKPYLIYRPYFIPNNGANPAIVEGYANGAVIKMREDYFRYPLIRQAYDEGRLIVKLFNETNIGGEGFARGRAGFSEALRYWKQARGVVKAAYPNAKFMSIANTPGNDDVWFTGDAPNAPYWYHGSEAAKANPTQAEINAAIASCPFREMFELCDYIGIHVYANIRSTVDGDLQTWYSRRHEQALKFLTPYIQQGKKMIINEWDLGYDEGQTYRAEAVVYGLNQIVGLNDAILCVNHWWNADKNEGAFTWDKHRTREDGTLLPVVHAVKAFREGAVPPPPDPAPPPPPPPNTTLTDRLAAALRTEFGADFEDLRGRLPQTTKRDEDGNLIRYPTIDSRGFDYIAFHHSETERSRTWANIASYHVNTNDWAGIGYHGGIRQGKVALFDSVDTKRAHVYGMNHEALGWCVTGRYDTMTLDERDLDAMKRVVKVCDSVYGHQKVIKGHGELRVGGYTACPGSDIKRVLPTLRQAAPQPPPPLPYTDEERAKAKWFTEQLARTLRGDTDATATLISALISEPKKAGLHNALVAKAVPSLEKVTT